jgi:hypothetical protein
MLKKPPLLMSLCLLALATSCIGAAHESSVALDAKASCTRALPGRSIALAAPTRVGVLRNYWRGGGRPIGAPGPLTSAFPASKASYRAFLCWTADKTAHLYTAWAVTESRSESVRSESSDTVPNAAPLTI